MIVRLSVGKRERKMGRSTKGLKHNCRLHHVKEDKLDKLYFHINNCCVNCINDCKNFKMDTEVCENRIQGESLNELIELIQEENINLLRFCEDYNLKLEYLLKMLKGDNILKYKYYICLQDRLHNVKNNEQINQEYEECEP